MDIMNIEEDKENEVFTVFDSDYHNTLKGFNSVYSITEDKKKNVLDDDDIMLLINTSEQCNRPKDMLKFLGMYFKATIYETDSI